VIFAEDAVLEYGFLLAKHCFVGVRLGANADAGARRFRGEMASLDSVVVSYFSKTGGRDGRAVSATLIVNDPLISDAFEDHDLAPCEATGKSEPMGVALPEFQDGKPC